MCGIIGIASNKSVTSNIINSLKRLEYRGYDSSGVATIHDNTINEKKCPGRVEELEKILFNSPQTEMLELDMLDGQLMVFNQINAHPHSSEVVSVVHNGIIENSYNLKKNLKMTVINLNLKLIQRL